jgi:hypothetical protein
MAREKKGRKENYNHATNNKAAMPQGSKRSPSNQPLAVNKA